MTKTMQPDEWLMGQVALGKQECVAPLVRRHANGLLTYIERMIGDRHRSEELLQEVFLAVWRHRAKYQFPRPFKPWLYTIAGNRCRSDFRRPRPDRISLDLDHESPIAPGPSPAQATVDVETARQVATAVAALPTKQRSVVVLRVWNGLSYAEIAEATGGNEGTVRSNMHHALATLRRTLAGEV